MVPSRAKVCSWSGSSNRLVGAAINPGRSLQVCAASMPASWLGRGHLTASATPILLWVHCWMPSRALGALLEHELQPRNLCFGLRGHRRFVLL